MSYSQVTKEKIEVIKAIPWVRSVRESDAKYGSHVIQTDCSVLTTDDEHTIENCGVTRRATSKIGDYRGLKVYVEVSRSETSATSVSRGETHDIDV